MSDRNELYWYTVPVGDKGVTKTRLVRRHFVDSMIERMENPSEYYRKLRLKAGVEEDSDDYDDPSEYDWGEIEFSAEPVNPDYSKRDLQRARNKCRQASR